MESSRPSVFRFPAYVADRLASAKFRYLNFRPELSLKLLLVVVAVTLIGILTSSSFMFAALRAQYIEQVKTSTARSNRMLIAGLSHDMLTHDSTMLNYVIQDVASEFDGEKIQILDQEGVIRGSSVMSEVGQAPDTIEQACQVCHTGETGAAVPQEMIIKSAESGGQVLLSANPIPNEKECNSCHAPSVKTLGVLITSAPLTELSNITKEGLQRVGLAAVVSFSLIVGLMVPALRKAIIEPISKLSKGFAEVSSENLNYNIQVDSHDELGQLENAFNIMQEHLRSSRLAVMHRSRELAVLYNIALVTGQLLDLPEILQRVLDIVIDQLELEVGIIYLRDPETARFEKVVSRGLSPEQLQLIAHKRQQPGGDLTLEVAQSGKVFFVQDASTNHHFRGVWEDPVDRSYVNIPLISQGKAVGTIELVGHAHHPLTDHQVEVLAAVGHQIGIAIDNNSLLVETQRGEREALTLYQLGSKVSSSLELDQVLDAIAQGAREALLGDIGIVSLLDSENREFVIRAISGAYSENWRGLRILVKDPSFFRGNRMIDLREPNIKLPAIFASLVQAEEVQTMLAVPLLRGDSLRGVVSVLTRSRRVFNSEDIRLLTRLAQQVVVAIENATLYQQVRYLAVLEERDRLAREMHDELAQALGYINLKASITSGQISSGEIEQAQASLVEMKDVARKAYTDTREAIFNLRNPISLGRDLVPMLSHYLSEYSVQYGIDARLIVESGAPVEFPTDVTLQLSRIIQEALTNVRKHAKATHAWVHFERQGQNACVLIEDNGQGFDPATVAGGTEGHFGLQIMRERAEGFGGAVEFTQKVGNGARVTITIPLSHLK